MINLILHKRPHRLFLANFFILLSICFSVSILPQQIQDINFRDDSPNRFNFYSPDNMKFSFASNSSNETKLKIPAQEFFDRHYLTDSIDNNYETWEDRKQFWFAVLELGVIEFIPWALARWGRTWEDPSKNWAKVTSETIWRNISYGWEYDGDNFLTNNFSHPYHGNLYFNAGRTNGYTFWESSIWAFAGSAAWEFFAETYRPAINDWINTSLNGINLGEMLYRLSSKITDNTASGSKRVFQEIGSAVLNPVRGINRVISGETSRIFPNNEESKTKITIELEVGVRRWFKDFDTGTNEGLFSVSLHYGNLFTGEIKKPFSSFNVSMVLATSAPSLTNLQSFGNLYGWSLYNKKGNIHKLLLSLNYNYFNNPTFIYGGTSINSHYLSVFKIGKETNIFTNAGLDFIAMGATPTDYYVDVEGRNYDFGPGIGINLGASINRGKWSIARIFYSSKWIWTQSEPSDSKHHLHFAWLDFEIPLYEFFAISLGAGVYWRNSVYKFEPDINKTNPAFRLSVKAALM